MKNRDHIVILLGIAASLVWNSAAHAGVTANKPGGFTVLHTAKTAAEPAAIWAQLLHPERWWSKNHTWSRDAANLSLNAAPSGCFCEKLPNGGFAEHARVIYAAPDRMLRLAGSLGPLQSEAAVGTLTMTVKPADGGGSVIEFVYVVGGNARFDMTDIGPAVDQVVGEQHQRLTKLIATGTAD